MRCGWTSLPARASRRRSTTIRRPRDATTRRVPAGPPRRRGGASFEDVVLSPGAGCAALLAGVTLVLLEVGTISMVDRSDDLSTMIEKVWSGGAQRSPDAEDTQ